MLLSLSGPLLQAAPFPFPNKKLAVEKLHTNKSSSCYEPMITTSLQYYQKSLRRYQGEIFFLNWFEDPNTQTSPLLVNLGFISDSSPCTFTSSKSPVAPHYQPLFSSDLSSDGNIR
ncbi:hypothetical protein R6Q59_007961 [Mikania micrantha]